MTGALLAWTLVLAAANPQVALDEAAERFQHGDPAGAADAYEAALGQGAQSADVYYNLGTAALRAGDVGRAVWALHEARLRAPWDGDVRFNLKLALEANTDTVVGTDEPAWEAALSAVPRVPLQYLAVGLLWVFTVLLVAWGIRRVRVLALWTMRAGGAALLAALVLMAVELTVGAPKAVVVQPEALVRSTDRADGPEAFRVHAGLVVNPQPGTETPDGMVRIRLENGLEGYVAQPALRAVGGPG